MSACFANQFTSPQRCSFLPKIYGFTRVLAASVFAMSEGKVHADVISPNGVIRACMKKAAEGMRRAQGNSLATGPDSPSNKHLT